jgi:hypothetical protein
MILKEVSKVSESPLILEITFEADAGFMHLFKKTLVKKVFESRRDYWHFLDGSSTIMLGLCHVNEQLTCLSKVLKVGEKTILNK